MNFLESPWWPCTPAERAPPHASSQPCCSTSQSLRLPTHAVAPDAAKRELDDETRALRSTTLWLRSSFGASMTAIVHAGRHDLHATFACSVLATTFLSMRCSLACRACLAARPLALSYAGKRITSSSCTAPPPLCSSMPTTDSDHPASRGHARSQHQRTEHSGKPTTPAGLEDMDVTASARSRPNSGMDAARKEPRRRRTLKAQKWNGRRAMHAR